MPANTLRIALLHLAPIPGDLARNRRLVETAVTAAARLGATWIITPELVVTGYTFADSLGTEWILPQPDSWMTHMSQLAAQLRVTLFLACPEQDRKSGKSITGDYELRCDDPGCAESCGGGYGRFDEPSIAREIARDRRKMEERNA